MSMWVMVEEHGSMARLKGKNDATRAEADAD